jgi:radical SAM superfamily enzyme YgiQ (UPF0313 family)
MRVVLISPYNRIEATGLRLLSACLKCAGFETRLIFLPNVRQTIAATGFDACPVNELVLAQILEQCQGAGMIGISVMTTSFFAARAITQALHGATNVPVIWGGVHPTIRPAECLQYADAVCIGEGEEMLVELAQRLAAGRAYDGIHNLARLDAGGHVIVNPLRPLIRDLDSLPFPDYDFEQHFVLHEDRLVACTAQLMYLYLTDFGRWARGPVYGLFTMRGCPYHCAYCINDALLGVYPNWQHLRRRTPENVIAEIEAIRSRLPEIGAINLRDDTFLANNPAYIAEFSQLYRQRIGLPFRAYTTAQTANADKLQNLIDAGLYQVIMGIQTGSVRMQQLFHRRITNEQVLRGAQLLHRFQARLHRPIYDVITDNPYETEADRLATLQLIHQLPAPYRLSLYSLTFYPGTQLYHQAKADGLIADEHATIYSHNFEEIKPNFYNFALFCHSQNLPRPLLRFLVRPAVFHALSQRPFDQWCGWLLKGLLTIRLRRNMRVDARRHRQWLGA